MKTTCKLLLLISLAFAPLSWAVIETYSFSSPELERRYQLLSAELRCPKCQNQNIADSNAPIAQDLRMLLHRQLEAGDSDRQITEFMVSRYGEFVLYRPRFSGAAMVLWLAPVFLLVLAVLVLVIAFRRRRRATVAQDSVLSPEDQARLAQLMTQSERDA